MVRRAGREEFFYGRDGPALKMLRARLFARCTVCTHSAVVREGAACALCGGAAAAVETPADLFSGWRCGCYHCTSTPC